MTPVNYWRYLLACVPALVGVAVAAALHESPGAARVAVLVTGAYAAAIVLGLIRRTTAAASPRAAVYRVEAVRPLGRLATFERLVALSRTSATEFEHRVQPELRRTAAERLRLRHGVDLDRDPDAARRLLGDATWTLITARHTRDDRSARAPEMGAILAAIERLEVV